MSDHPTVVVATDGPVMVVAIDRPEVRNAVDRPTADALAEAFGNFEGDDSLAVAVLTGTGDTFCSGADLRGVSDGRGNRVDPDMAVDGPMGPTRMDLSKPVIAAVEGSRSPAGSSWRCGAISGSRPATPPSGSTAAGGVCPSSTVARFASPAWSATGGPWT